MRIDNIVIDPFRFISLKVCSLFHEVGKHSYAQVSGYIKESNKDRYMQLLNHGTEVSIKSDSGDILFIGIIKNGEIAQEGNSVFLLTLSLISYSFLLDNVPKTRIFQQPETTYNELLDHINSSYSDSSVVMTVGFGEPLEKIITQYRETDWEFMTRIASRFNVAVTPAYLFSGIKYYFGIPENSKPLTIDIERISIKKSLDSYTNKMMNDVEVLESDEICYEITSRDFAKIADNIFVDEMDGSSRVYAVESHLLKEQLVHKYYCKPQNGFKTKRIYNTEIIGVSLEGSITDVKQDIVKVYVPSSDTKQDIDKTIWLPYSTVYSSPDGTGWYAMPEVGDSVRVYFPNEKEEEAYIVSATHLENSEDLRQDPNHKSIRSKYGKEVEFTPSTIRISNNNGMEILMDDEEGISIVSDKKIAFSSDEAVSLTSINANMSVVAKENVSIVQNETAIVLEDNIGVSGAQVHVQK